ncbi:Uncharacterised protein [Enterobacter cloacae]|nr:Uncharacterised protein [Enterobacter cloacae]
MNGSGIPPVTTVSVFQSTYSLLPVISIRAVLTHEMLVHQIIINALKLWVNAARNPRHSSHLFHHHRVMHGVMRIFTPGEWTMLVHHNTRRMQWFRLTQRFDNDPAGVKFVLAFDLSLR